MCVVDFYFMDNMTYRTFKIITYIETIGAQHQLLRKRNPDTIKKSNLAIKVAMGKDACYQA